MTGSGSSLDWLLQSFRTRRATLAGCLVAGAALLSVVNYQPRSYSAHASFIPQASGAGRAAISGFAAQLGLSVPGAEAGASPAFYADLIKSEEIVRGVAETPFTVAAAEGSRTGTLVELLAIDGPSDPVRQEVAVTTLRSLTGVVRNRETGVIRFSVRMPWPDLAKQVADRFVALVNEFNLERRQSQASAERVFVEARLEEVRTELRLAEGKLQGFLTANRDYRNSPRLGFEHERLADEVAMRRQVASSLAQSYEQARIDQVRDTPVITVIESPRVAAMQNPRGLVKNVVLGLLVGLLAFVGIAFGSALRSQASDV